MDNRAIAAKLADAFVNSRMTFDDLAEKTKIPKSALHRYMTGDTEKIPIDRFNLICNALGLNAVEVLGWDSCWDDTSHKEWNQYVTNRIEEEKQIEQKPEQIRWETADKAKIYQALGALGRVDMDSAITLFKTLVEQNVL